MKLINCACPSCAQPSGGFEDAEGRVELDCYHCTMKTTTQVHLTAEEFERWVSQQLALGFTCNTPDALAKVRAEFRKRGAGHIQTGTLTHETPALLTS